MSTMSLAHDRSVVFRRTALAGAIAAAALLSACAPVQEGKQHCHPIDAYITKNKDEALAPMLDAPLIAQIDTYVQGKMQNTVNAPVSGCGVAVTLGDRIALLRTYGEADVATHRPFDLGTLSAIGSVSKTYTALGMLRLMEMQKVNLLQNAFVYTGSAKTVPWADATVEQLLTHQAGLTWMPTWDANAFHDAASMKLAFSDVPYPQLKPRLVIQGFENVAANSAYAIGGQPHYSNVAYAIAGAVIDQVSQSLPGDAARHGYEGFIWNEIGRGNAVDEPASPAMCLGAEVREDMVPTLATGYDSTGKHASFSDDKAHGWGWPGASGSWWVTTGDLARLMVTLQSDAAVHRVNIDSHMRDDHGELFPEENGDESFKESMHAGMGLELSPPGTSPSWYGKSGGIAGYSAHVRIWPDAKEPEKSIGVAMMCNRSGVSTEIIDHVRGMVFSATHIGTGGIKSTSESAPMPQVRRELSRYATDGRLDDEGVLRLIRDTAQSPDGQALLDAAAREDWATLAALVRRRYTR